MEIHSKNYVHDSTQVIYYIAHTLKIFLIFGKNGFRSSLINGPMDFRPDFADFWNFSGLYDGHTYSPPKKKHANGRTDPVVLEKHGRTRTTFRNSVAISSSCCPCKCPATANYCNWVSPPLPLPLLSFGALSLLFFLTCGSPRALAFLMASLHLLPHEGADISSKLVSSISSSQIQTSH